MPLQHVPCRPWRAVDISPVLQMGTPDVVSSPPGSDTGPRDTAGSGGLVCFTPPCWACRLRLPAYYLFWFQWGRASSYCSDQPQTHSDPAASGSWKPALQEWLLKGDYKQPPSYPTSSSVFPGVFLSLPRFLNLSAIWCQYWTKASFSFRPW